MKPSKPSVAEKLLIGMVRMFVFLYSPRGMATVGFIVRHGFTKALALLVYPYEVHLPQVSAHMVMASHHRALARAPLAFLTLSNPA